MDENTFDEEAFETMMEEGERQDQAMEMLDSLLDHIRMIEGTVFNYEEPMDEHLTHLLFYSATRLQGEEFAKHMMETAELAIEMAKEHEDAEKASRSKDPEVEDVEDVEEDVKGDARRVYH